MTHSQSPTIGVGIACVRVREAILQLLSAIGQDIENQPDEAIDPDR